MGHAKFKKIFVVITVMGTQCILEIIKFDGITKCILCKYTYMKPFNGFNSSNVIKAEVLRLLKRQITMAYKI